MIHPSLSLSYTPTTHPFNLHNHQKQTVITMASQSGGITVQHNPSPTSYRLIELPPDLLSLLESDDAPV